MMSLDQFIVLVAVGAIAGTLTGWLVAWKKGGFGFWANTGVGIVGALLGGVVFDLFGIDLGLSGIKFTLEDVVAALIGSLLLIFIWWVVQQTKSKKSE